SRRCMTLRPVRDGYSVFHGILRLRFARFATYTPLRMTPCSRFSGSRAPPILVEHCRCSSRATSTSPKLAHSDQPIEIADASGSLHPHAWRTALPHESKIVLRRTLIVVASVRLLDESVSGRCLHPIGTGTFANHAQPFLEFIATQSSTAFREVIRFEYHFHLRDMLVRTLAEV